MASCILFHGPGALQAVLQEARQIGRLMASPFGGGGLKVNEAREFVSLMNSTPVGEGVGVVVAGPMDLALLKSSDTLLKCIEEFNPTVMYPLLWAHDLGGVSGTIRSRCLDRWCPATGLEEPDPELQAVARGLVAAALARQLWKLPPLLASVKKDEGTGAGSGDEGNEEAEAGAEDGDEAEGGLTRVEKLVRVLGLMADELAPRIHEPKVRALWEQVRLVTRWPNPRPIEIVAALAGGAD
jgi:hypothetical protein